MTEKEGIETSIRIYRLKDMMVGVRNIISEAKDEIAAIEKKLDVLQAEIAKAGKECEQPNLFTMGAA
ncbi:MAG: hypothetical protein FWB90_00635 [Fibromonadales bacterium]|nr:hypothetical protein [Fibromonadales bacterium]